LVLDEAKNWAFLVSNLERPFDLGKNVAFQQLLRGGAAINFAAPRFGAVLLSAFVRYAGGGIVEF
jgi:hypothetical protein